MDTALVVKGSIKDVADGGDTTTAIMDARIVLICDRSTSMYERDMYSTKSRYQAEDDIIISLQEKHAGQIALIGFSDSAWFELDGKFGEPHGETYITSALRLAQPLAECDIRCVLISDGEPSDPEDMILELAKSFKGKLDTIFIGTQGSGGDRFLQKVATATYGTHQSNKVDELMESLMPLLLKAGIS